MDESEVDFKRIINKYGCEREGDVKGYCQVSVLIMRVDIWLIFEVKTLQEEEFGKETWEVQFLELWCSRCL